MVSAAVSNTVSNHASTASSGTEGVTKSKAHDGTSPAAPLTTVYTPAASCYAWGNPDEPESCYPDNWDEYISTAGYYSPGICPEGLTSAGNPTDSGMLMGPPVEETETGIYCCTESYALAWDDSIGGSSMLLCEGQYTTGTAGTTGWPYHFAIQVRWAEADLEILETTPLTGNEDATTTAGANDTETSKIGATDEATTGSLIDPYATTTPTGKTGDGDSGVAGRKPTSLAWVLFGCLVAVGTMP
ncbi:hypothetical protein MKZ38_010211 [Zalerion maritima]|uniref:Uncharacterized protein n=1 Tax=Zalerion maritima TaxID=339359 RepID=A0AAD5WLW4_9PEZI|nr:hypothetical protein MKZ38_010211 [Zalerion maritima]